MKIGIDIGGSHIGIGLVDNNGSIILKEEKLPDNPSPSQIAKALECEEKRIFENLLQKKEIGRGGL